MLKQDINKLSALGVTGISKFSRSEENVVIRLAEPLKKPNEAWPRTF